jgi:DNA-binding NarL/FixJ family response regulator
MRKIRILLIEDDKKKSDDIINFINARFPHFDVSLKESYHSGLKSLFKEKYDLLLLDMSMPTWDRSPFENGGEYEKFGGIKILKELNRKKKILPTILITMFDNFGESDNSITLSQMNLVLNNDYDSFYLGSVFYRSDISKWQEDLETLISSLRND